jgi:hypothetical protein
LGSTERYLDKLNTEINKLVSATPGGVKIKYSRVGWIRNKGKIKEICADIQRLTFNLGTMLTADNSFHLHRMRILLEEMSERGHTLAIAEGHAARAEMVISSLDDDSTEELPAFSSSSDQDSTAETPDGDLSTDQASTDSITKNLASDFQNSQSTCPKWCSCICHRHYTLSTPQLLNPIFGKLQIGLNDSPLNRPTCNEKLCRRRNPATNRITYRFPQWILAKSLVMALQFRSAGPQFSLTTLNVLPHNAEIFRLAMSGNVSAMREMFGKGAASIYDVDGENFSLVHVSGYPCRSESWGCSNMFRRKRTLLGRLMCASFCWS